MTNVPKQLEAEYAPNSPRSRKRDGAAATGLVAMLVDAWHELRVNRVRILLALIGICLAVIGLTAAFGAGQMLMDVQTEALERAGGRTATIQVEAESTPQNLERMEHLPNDFGITHHSFATAASATAWTPQRQVSFTVNAVEPMYGEIFRAAIAQGRFLTDADGDLLAPAIVVNETLWTAIGAPNLAVAPRVTLVAGEQQQVFTLVGVMHNSGSYERSTAWILYDQLAKVPRQTAAVAQTTQLYLWVPDDIADQFANQLGEQLSAQGFSVHRSDWAKSAEASLVGVQWYGAAVAAGMFLLGALGLVNINLVTMQHRVREIGIRRSYGASSARIFFGVLLESVVATFVAGAVGVLLTVLVATSPLVTDLLRSMGVYEPHPFPLSAALIGLTAATVVGALAGALPAIRATRIQIIDAIRY